MAKRHKKCRFGVVKRGRRKGSCLKVRRARKSRGLSGARRRRRSRR